jgi:hypothetical protein
LREFRGSGLLAGQAPGTEDQHHNSRLSKSASHQASQAGMMAQMRCQIERLIAMAAMSLLPL